MIGNRPDRPNGGYFRARAPQLEPWPPRTLAKRLFALFRLHHPEQVKIYHLEATPSYVRKIVNEPCVYCGGQAGTRDHLVPVSEGGRADWHNLAPSCGQCNSERGSQSPLLYLVRKRAETPIEARHRRHHNPIGWRRKKPRVVPAFTWDYPGTIKWDDRQR